MQMLPLMQVMVINVKNACVINVNNDINANDGINAIDGINANPSLHIHSKTLFQCRFGSK